MTELDNSGFFEQLRADASRRAQVDEYQLPTNFTLSTIRLPKPNKAAFSSVDLFRQQASMATADIGLQVLLDTLHGLVMELTGQYIDIDRMQFIMNFGGAQTESTKHFSCRMTFPIIALIELTRRIAGPRHQWDVRYVTEEPAREETIENFQPNQRQVRRLSEPMVERVLREERGIDVDP